MEALSTQFFFPSKVAPVDTETSKTACTRIFDKIKELARRIFEMVMEWFCCMQREEKEDVPASFKEKGFDKVYASGSPAWWTKIRGEMRIPELEETYKECLSLNLNLEPVIVLESDGNFSIGGKGTTLEKIKVAVHGKLYPICTGGVNRSQVIYRVACRQLGEASVMLPHGAVKAHDSFFSDRVSPLDGKGVPLQDFQEMSICDVERKVRFGKGLENAKQFEEAYWLPLIEEGGTVIVAGVSTHAILYRLNKLAQRERKDLKKVHVVPIVTEDPFGVAEKERPQRVVSYLKSIHSIHFRQV